MGRPNICDVQLLVGKPLQPNLGKIAPTVSRRAIFPRFGCKVLVAPGSTMRLSPGASSNVDAKSSPRVGGAGILAQNRDLAWGVLTYVTFSS